MKKYLLALICAFFCATTVAQNISLRSVTDVPMKDKDSVTIDFPRVTNMYPTNIIWFSITKVPAKGITVKINDDNNEGADVGTDYSYVKINGVPQHLTSDSTLSYSSTFADSKDILLPVEIRSKNMKPKFGKFTLVLTNGSDVFKTYKIIMRLNSASNVVAPDESTAIGQDTSKWFLNVVTGGNFDFFNGPSIKDFAGDMTLFMPNLVKLFNSGLGVEFGISNYHYFNSDTSHTNIYRDSYFLHYSDYYSPTDNAKVIIDTKNVNRKYDYNVWGIHGDLLYQLNSSKFIQLYSKLHFEELMTIETYTPAATRSVYDTISYAQYKNTYQSLKLLNSVPDPNEVSFYQYKQHSFHDLYFGEGIAMVANFKNVAKFCISSIYGITSLELAQPNFFPNDPSNRNIVNPDNSHSRVAKFFTLNKFQFITTVAPIDIALGGEYRTVASNMYYFTTYIGASITLDKLKR